MNGSGLLGLMKRITCLAMLLLVGCQAQKNDAASRGEEAQPTPPPTPGDEPPTSTSVANPWIPRTAAAQFLSLPTETWNENGLELAAYALDITVKEGVATATLDVSVTNPTAEQAEAVIKLPIPPGAAVTSATLWMGDKPMVGVMLGSGKAREVYDQIVKRRRDPLLVEWDAADMLGLSIFPLEAKQTRRFSVTWVEPVVTDKQWVPSFHNKGELVGFPKRIVVNGATAERDGDWVTIPQTTPPVAGEFRMRIQQATQPSVVALVLDTSAASSGQQDGMWEEAESFLTALDSNAKVTILAADWILHELGSGRDAADIIAAKGKFMSIRSAGLFDQRQAFARAVEIAGSTGAIAVVSNQMPSDARNTSLDVPVYWLGFEALFGHNVVDRSGGRWVNSGVDLARTVRQLVRPSEPGFEWLPLESATGHVVWLGYEKDGKVDSESAAAPMEALFYRAMLRRANIPLNKIVAPQTSILVLESERQYKRWGVKDEDGKLVRDRAGSSSTISGLLEEANRETPGVSGLGNFGTIGHGNRTGFGYGLGGTGSGYGLTGGRGGSDSGWKSMPQVRIGNATVEGDLDANIVRRDIRRKMPHIRYCYEKELLLHDQLSGTATAEFVIARDGKVAKVEVSMPLADGAATSECIKRVLAGIQFPKPSDGGNVNVKYKFVIRPGAAAMWSEARKLWDAGKPGYEKEIGAVFGYTGELGRVQLAWWLAENYLRFRQTPVFVYRIVADLLRAGNSPADSEKDDARRILSEAAYRDADEVMSIFREWGFAADAERVKSLSP